MTATDLRAVLPLYDTAIAFQSPCTIKQKKISIEKFLSFLTGREEEVITPDVVLEYRASLRDYRPATINQYLKTLRGLFTWLLDLGHWSGGNPVHASFLVREAQTAYPCILTDEEMQRVWWAQPDGRVGRNLTAFYRRKAEVLLLLTSAVRCSEMTAIRPADLDWEQHTIRIVCGKGGKHRTVLFHETAQAAVRAYLQHARPRGAGQDDALFLMPERGGGFHPLPQRTAEYDVKAYIRETTGREDAFPHAMRHTSARHMISNGMPAKEIQTVLGHASLGMTEHYARLLAPDLAPVQAAASVFDTVYPI